MMAAQTLWRGNTCRGQGGRFSSPYERCPDDFEATMIRIGRLACEEHYRVGRKVVTNWLDECGKDLLIAKRAEFVKARETERRSKLTRREMGALLSNTFPDPDRTVSLDLAREAACYLRAVRNGGFSISAAADGSWWVGISRKSAAELVDLARLKGFNPSLTSDGSSKVE